jgi:hypothetical protein
MSSLERACSFPIGGFILNDDATIGKVDMVGDCAGETYFHA